MSERPFRLVRGGAGDESTKPHGRAGSRAAIFDMDGLLIDSEPLWRRAEQTVFEGVGLELTDEDCETTTGMRIDAVVRHWYHLHPWPLEPAGAALDAVAARIVREVERLVKAEGEPLPGVHAALAGFASAGWRLGLASSSPPELIDAVLERLDLDGCFETLRSAAELRHGKPDPEVYLVAAADLGVAPARCVALEDSASGVLAAQRAGMRVVAVPEREPAEDSAVRHADLLLESLEQLDPERLDAWVPPGE